MSDSLYSKYISEREGFEIIENLFGFATYKITGDDCYIRDVYIDPAFRREKRASDLVDKIKEKARDKDCKRMVTTVCPSAKGSNESLKAVVAYGFELQSAVNDFIFFKIDV